VADDDFAEMGAALEIAVCVRRLVEREYPINHRPQPMDRDGTVHRLETNFRQGLEAMNRALKSRAQGGKGPGL